MLSVKGIFNGKTVELLEDVPYQEKVPVIYEFVKSRTDTLCAYC